MGTRGNRCRCCVHRERTAIDLALARGVSAYAIGKRYGVGHDSVYRHAKAHLPPQLRAKLIAGPDLDIDVDRLKEIEGQSLLANLVALRHRLFHSLDVAEECGDGNMISRIAGQLHKNMEIVGKLLGDLGVGSTTINNVLISNSYVELRVGLTEALAAFPEARTAVAHVLHRTRRQGSRPGPLGHRGVEDVCAMSGMSRDLARCFDPCMLMHDAGLTPDDWQARLLRERPKRVLCCCSRQSGKTEVAITLAEWTALFESGSLTLIVSPSQRQSGEVFRRLMLLHSALKDVPRLVAESALRAEYANGSRVVALPGSERTTRGYAGARLVILDEASRVEDSLLASLRPTMATVDGRLLALSTPAGQRGWFHKSWTEGEDWHRIRVPASESPRLSKEFLDEELRELGPTMYEQEYELAFLSDSEALFNYAIIAAAFTADVQPLWG